MAIENLQTSIKELDDSVSTLVNSINNFLISQKKFEDSLDTLIKTGLDPSTIPLQNNILVSDSTLKKLAYDFGHNVQDANKTLDTTVQALISALQPTPTPSQPNGLSGGAIAGIVIAVVVVIAIVAYFYIYARSRGEPNDNDRVSTDEDVFYTPVNSFSNANAVVTTRSHHLSESSAADES